MKYIFLIVSNAVFLISGNIYSQNIKIGAEVGGTLPFLDYSGSTIDFFNGTKYGMKTTVNFGAMGKFGIPSTSMAVRTGVSYFVPSNEGLARAEDLNGRVETKSHILSILAGPEFYFPIPRSILKPYAGINITLSSIGAKVTFQNVSGVPDGTFIISSGTRLGAGVSAGTEIRLSGVTFDIGARFNFYNITGKEFVEIPPNDRVHSYLNVNDKKDPNFNNSNEHFIGNDRNIGSVQLSIGVLFGL